jgi:hypothetical protein
VSVLLFFLKQDEEKAFEAGRRFIIGLNKGNMMFWLSKAGRYGNGNKK